MIKNIPFDIVIMPYAVVVSCLTHWGRVTQICVSKLTIIGSNNGLSPSRRQAIIWTNAGVLLIGPLSTNFSDILIGIHIQENTLENVVCEMASILSQPQCVKGGWIITTRHSDILHNARPSKGRETWYTYTNKTYMIQSTNGAYKHGPFHRPMPYCLRCHRESIRWQRR